MSHTKTTHQHRCPPSLPPFIPTSLLVVAALPWSEEGTERALQNSVENLPLHPSPFFRHKAHGTPSCVVGAAPSPNQPCFLTQSTLLPHPINLASSPNQPCFLTQSTLLPHPINLASSPNQPCFLTQSTFFPHPINLVSSRWGRKLGHLLVAAAWKGDTARERGGAACSTFWRHDPWGRQSACLCEIAI